MKLTDVKVRNAKAKVKDYRLTDGHGLHLFVKENGSKLWRYRYEFNGKEKLMSYGAYPDITVATARELHEKARKTLLSGRDPMLEKQSDEQLGNPVVSEDTEIANPFVDVANKWYDWWKSAKDERYASNVRSRLDGDILPPLGNLAISSITPTQVTNMVLAIEARGAGDIARRALQTVDQIYRFAIPRSLTTYNPASTFKPKDILKPIVRENFKRVAPGQLPGLIKKIHFYNGSPVTRLCMKLMALVFLRTSELIEGRLALRVEPEGLAMGHSQGAHEGARGKKAAAHRAVVQTSGLRVEGVMGVPAERQVDVPW